MEAQSINPKLMCVNLSLLDMMPNRAKNQPMVEKTQTFGDRFEQLRGGMAYQALSDAIHRKTGRRISPQGMHKWSKGGGIELDKVKVLAEFFGVSEAWLLYGDGPIGEAIDALPEDSRQQVLDFISYKIEKAEGLIASDAAAHYLDMIDRIKADMAKRKKSDDGTE